MTFAKPDSQSLEDSFSLVTEVPVPPGIDEHDLKSLANAVLQQEAAPGVWEITVALVADDRLQALHRDFMGIDTPTDIMTFPGAESGEELQSGEIVISVDHAMTRAGSWGLSPADEIRFLVIHGLLHLLGWRDETEHDRARMLTRQQVLLDEWRGRNTT